MTLAAGSGHAYVEQFARAKASLPGAGVTWLDDLRDESIGRFVRNGLPTPKIEAWKYTNLDRLARTTFRIGTAAPAQVLTKRALEPYKLSADCHLVVYVNGRLRPDLCDLDQLPHGTRITDLAAATSDDLRALAVAPAMGAGPQAAALSDLNTALMAGGAIIRLGRGAVLDPVQILFMATPDGEPSAFHLRNLIDAEAGSSATVLETFVAMGDGPYWSNVVTRVSVAPNAVLRHHKLQAEGAKAVHIAATSVRLDRDAAYRMFSASIGAELGRNEIAIELAAPGTEVQLAGVTLARSNQHLDTTTRISHAQPRTTSSQVFKSVVDEHAHAVFQGSIRVAPDAQKSDARQLSQNLLLSATAAADTKPELEILADDVKCSHGAAVGDLDRDALFYLRARGLSARVARALLIGGFIGELIESIEGDAARAYFRRVVDHWLTEGQS